VGVPWLEDNATLVRGIMTSHCDQLRSALDIVGEGLEGGGVSLNDALVDNPNCACWALQCTLANLQVWGTLSKHREDGELGAEMQVADHDIEQFLSKDDHMLTRVSMKRPEEAGQSLSPEMITAYHRRLARVRVGHVQREFRRRLSALQNVLMQPMQPAGCSSPCSGGANGSPIGGAGETQVGENAERLLRTVLHHLTAVESFVSSLSRFFKSVDLAAPYSRQHGRKVQAPQACPIGRATGSPKSRVSHAKEEAAVARSDSSDEGLKGNAAMPQPNIDHATSGYIMHVDCGHNGLLDEDELRQLSLHLSAAGFGRTKNIRHG